MILRRRDVASLALAAATALAGLAVWLNGEVELGLVLGTDDAGHVRVIQVEPGSIAARSGLAPGQIVTGLEATDGAQIEHRTEVLSPELGGEAYEIPTEPLPEWRILYVETGTVYEDIEGDEQLYPGGATLYRWTWQDRLQFGGVLLLLGAGFGALVGAAVA
ncbi:MAG: hypothetical protein ACRDHD_13175, partial [Candidatus Limnocylindria bacterium]